MENARLYEDAQGKAVLEERQRLARALHDSVTQSLYSLTLFTQTAQRRAGAGDMDRVQENLRQISETAAQSLKDMRLLVYELRRTDLEKIGLVAALQQRLNSVEKRAGMDARLDVRRTAGPAPVGRRGAVQYRQRGAEQLAEARRRQRGSGERPSGGRPGGACR